MPIFKYFLNHSQGPGKSLLEPGKGPAVDKKLPGMVYHKLLEEWLGKIKLAPRARPAGLQEEPGREGIGH